jgi:hypothetical protein
MIIYFYIASNMVIFLLKILNVCQKEHISQTNVEPVKNMVLLKEWPIEWGEEY